MSSNIMDLWGLPLEEAEEPLLHSASVAPLSTSITPLTSPIAKKEMMLNCLK
jgi:hypothetical protein